MENTCNDPARLLADAAAGDRRAWEEIVDRYAGTVRSVTRGFRLAAQDAEDVSQATWLRLVENLGRIRDPHRLGAWLTTTARREAVNLLRRAARDIPTDHLEALPAPDGDAPVEREVLRNERDADLRCAFRSLNPMCQRLLRVLLEERYADATVRLRMPAGSIGPTRGRCLDALRRRLAAQRP